MDEYIQKIKEDFVSIKTDKVLINEEITYIGAISTLNGVILNLQMEHITYMDYGKYLAKKLEDKGYLIKYDYKHKEKILVFDCTISVPGLSIPISNTRENIYDYGADA